MSHVLDWIGGVGTGNNLPLNLGGDTRCVVNSSNYIRAFVLFHNIIFKYLKGDTRNRHKGKKLKVKVLFLKQLINKMN